MKLTEHALTIAKLTPPAERSPGVHLSEILRYLLTRQDPGRFKPGGEFDPEFVFAGFIWEELVSGALSKLAGKSDPKRYITQLEILFREVYCTIDVFDTKLWRVLECKYTESSSGRSIRDHHFWHYFAQIKAYCLATGTREAELWVYFARGDYKGKRREAKRWEVRFSERELEENWMMISSAARQMREEGVIS